MCTGIGEYILVPLYIVFHQTVPSIINIISMKEGRQQQYQNRQEVSVIRTFDIDRMTILHSMVSLSDAQNFVTFSRYSLQNVYGARS